MATTSMFTLFLIFLLFEISKSASISQCQNSVEIYNKNRVVLHLGRGWSHLNAHKNNIKIIYNEEEEDENSINENELELECSKSYVLSAEKIFCSVKYQRLLDASKIKSIYMSGKLVCEQSKDDYLSYHNIYKRSTDEIACGESVYDPNIRSLLAGGRGFRSGDWPWMAALFHDLKFICSGTIVSDKVIVTAAHCIQDKGENEQRLPEQSYFVIGKHSLKSRHERNFRVSPIEKFVVHPSWKPYRQKYDADIALGILQNRLQFNHHVKPICLPQQIEDPLSIVGLTGTIAGWGVNDQNTEVADVPTIVELPIISEDACVSANFNYEIIMSHRTFCSGHNVRRGPCKGDSGSGLAIKQNDVWKLYGIVSATLAGSCDGQSSVVFASVGQFVNWIQGVIDEVNFVPTTTTPAPQIIIITEKVPESWKDKLADQEQRAREEVNRWGDQIANTFGW